MGTMDNPGNIDSDTNRNATPLPATEESRKYRVPLVGITGPSGSGKSSLTSALCASTTSGRWIIVNEDPQTYKSGVDPSPYSSRCPSTERPDNVYWDVVQSQIDKAIESAGATATEKNTLHTDNDSSAPAIAEGFVQGVIFEHFLLPYLPRVSDQLDYLIVLDGTLDETDNTENGNNMLQILRERRVNRNPTRTESEKAELRRYYQEAVWVQYRDHTQKAILNLIEQMKISSSQEKCVLMIDPLQNELDLIVQVVEHFLSGK